MTDRSTTVVLLNWNGWRDTVECLVSLLHLSEQEPRIVVCDNASTDDSWSQLCAWCEGHLPDDFAIGESESQHRITLLQTGSNLGFAGGCNVGIRYAMRDAGCQFVWLLNNDTVVEPNSLRSQVQQLRESNGIGLMGSTLVYYDDPTRVQCFGGYRFNFWTGRVRPFASAADRTHPPSAHQAERELRYVSGASTLVTRGFLESVGLLNEQYFLYFEEVDWAVRGSGYQLSYCPQSVVLHKEGRSIGSNNTLEGRSLQSERWLSRNRVLFTRTYFPFRLPVVLGWMLCAVLVRACTGKLPFAVAMLHGILQGCSATIVPPPRLAQVTGASMRKAGPLY